MEPENKVKRNISLRDIALELNLSHATVSMALRGLSRVSEFTRERVKEKAEEMGYLQDPMLSALSRYRVTRKENPRRTVLAWINPFRDPEMFYEMHEFRAYWNGAKAAARQLGFQLEEFTAALFSLKQLEQEFRGRHISGLIVPPITNKAAALDWNAFPWADFSAVRIGNNERGPSIRYVTSAQVGNTIQALKIMTEKGYRRIGYVGRRVSTRMYVSGCLGFQSDLPPDRKVLPLLVDDGDSAPALDALAAWMETFRPDAVLTDMDALPEMLAELGWSVPGDIGLATLSIHDTPINAGIDQKPLEIGAAAVRALVCLLNEHHFGIPAVRNSVLVEGRWVDGSMLPNRS